MEIWAIPRESYLNRSSLSSSLHRQKWKTVCTTEHVISSYWNNADDWSPPTERQMCATRKLSEYSQACGCPVKYLDANTGEKQNLPWIQFRLTQTQCFSWSDLENGLISCAVRICVLCGLTAFSSPNCLWNYKLMCGVALCNQLIKSNMPSLLYITSSSLCHFKTKPHYPSMAHCRTAVSPLR